MAIVCMVNHTAVDLTAHQQQSSLEKVSKNHTKMISYEAHRYANLSAESLNETSVLESDDVNAPYSTSSCNSPIQANDLNREDGEYNWSKDMQGLLLGALYWGYVPLQILGGYLMTRFGIRRTVGPCMFAMSILTLLTHAAALISPWALFVLRILLGTTNAMGMPGMFFILTTWGPSEEKGRLLSIIFCGNFVSNVLIFPIAGLLCSYGFAGGWPSIFYVSGIANLIWCVFWYFIVYDSPLTHPHIHPKEKEYIVASLKLTSKSSTERKSRKGAPWRHIFTSLPVISVICAQFSMNWGMYLILSSLPLYMREILKFDVKSNGLFTMLPFISMWFVLSLSGMASDWTSRRFGLAVARKSATIVGQVIPAILYIIVSYLDCESIPLVMALLCISIGLMATNFVGPIVNFFDIAGEHVGQVMTLSNTISNIPGILTPYIVAEFTKDNTREQWQHVFFLTAGLMCFCSLMFVVFSKYSTQHWAVEITVEPEENEKLNEL
ncbi:hypothetical protein SNE40_009209 [Patella caerulea]